MASTKGYLGYVLDLLSEVPEIRTRKMMGEYLLYASDTLFGGIYDDRFLVKDTPSSALALPTLELPYEGASPMRLVDMEDPHAIADLVGALRTELPSPHSPKKSRRSTRGPRS